MLSRKLSKNEFKIYQGTDWPTYENYILDKVEPNIKLEIQKIEKEVFFDNVKFATQNFIEVILSLFTFQFPIFRFCFLIAFPAIAGLFLFFSIGGSLLEFVALFFIFRFINVFSTLINHRWLCHYQFEPKFWARPLLLFFIILGTKTASPGNFIKSHWAHHTDMDTEHDPYPPTFGLLKLCIFVHQWHKTYRFGRWMCAKDIKFVFRNIFWLSIITWIIIGMISLKVLSMMLFMILYDQIAHGIDTYYYHDGGKSNKPVDKYPFLGYFSILFLGTEWVHRSHHEKPWNLNFSKDSDTELIDLGYYILKPFSKFETGNLRIN